MALLSPPARAWPALLLWLGSLLFGASSATAAGEAVEEYRLKGAFLYNFAKYVEWPEAATAGREALEVCVVGSSDVSGQIAASLSGKAVLGRSLRVRDVPGATPPADCQMLFVTREGGVSAEQIADRTAGRSVLTIGEVPGFAERGGMINFTRQGTKLRFQVNPAAADREGLRLSSHLLKLADVVKD